MFKSGAEAGNADGMYNLALMYSRGQCVEVNHDMAIEWLLKAANCPIKIPRIHLKNPGVVAAQNSLGLRFLNGIGVVKIVVSVYWFT